MFFSTMALPLGYYNLPIYEDNKNCTAFSSPLELHNYNRLPQGLCNSPATFMRMMLSVFGNQNFLNLPYYVDDVLIFGRSEEESLQCAVCSVVFQRLKEHNFTLSSAMRNIYRAYHSQDGIASNSDKVDAIVNAVVLRLL